MVWEQKNKSRNCCNALADLLHTHKHTQPKMKLTFVDLHASNEQIIGLQALCLHEESPIIDPNSGEEIVPPELLYDVEVVKVDRDPAGVIKRFCVHYLEYKTCQTKWFEKLIHVDEQARRKQRDAMSSLEKFYEEMRKRQKKCASEEVVANNLGAGDSFKLLFSSTLRKVLVDDFEKVTLKKQLVRIPRKPNIQQIFTEYVNHAASPFGICSELGKVSKQEATQILDGLTISFERVVGTTLLYQFELLQYDAIRKKHPSEDEGSLAVRDLPLRKRKRLSLLYGPEHLLRFFVKLHEILPVRDVQVSELGTLFILLNDLVKFISSNKQYFNGAYAPASRNYLSAIKDYRTRGAHFGEFSHNGTDPAFPGRGGAITREDCSK